MRAYVAMVSAVVLFLAGGASLTAHGQDVVISEFLAVGMSRDTPDWIEIHNPGEATAELTSWHLTDDVDLPTKWTFPRTHIPGRGFLMVHASDARGGPWIDGELHANFKLKGEGEYLALIRPDGRTVQHAYSPQYPPQSAGVSYGLASTEDVEPLGAYLSKIRI